MQSKGLSTPAAVKKFQSAIAEHGSIISGDPGVQLHHIFGASAKHDKLPVGQWALLPLTPKEHALIGTDSGRKQLSLSHYGHLSPGRWLLEKSLYCELICAVGVHWLPAGVFDAIQGYRK